MTSKTSIIVRKRPDNTIKKTQRFKNDTQRFTYDCGVSSVKMLLDLYDIPENRKDLKKSLGSSYDYGTAWENIEDYILGKDKFEIRMEQYNIRAAQRYLRRNFPLLICWCYEGVSHYSVMISIGRETIKILNPWDKKLITTYNRKNFVKYWADEKKFFMVLIPYKKEAHVSKDKMEKLRNRKVRRDIPSERGDFKIKIKTERSH